MSVAEQLERDLVAAGAEILNVEPGFVAARIGERSASVDIWIDGVCPVAYIHAGEGDTIEPDADFVKIENPGAGLALDVLDLLRKVTTVTKQEKTVDVPLHPITGRPYADEVAKATPGCETCDQFKMQCSECAEVPHA